jgi:quercetin dioxygenase-like cupin family protein
MTSFVSAHMPTLAGFSPVPGVTMSPLAGRLAMINYIAMEPGAVVPRHSHPHEQLGYVVAGSIALDIAGDIALLGPGDGYTLAGGVEHSGTAGADGCVVVDVFAPVREDYRDRAAEARGGA